MAVCVLTTFSLNTESRNVSSTDKRLNSPEPRVIKENAQEYWSQAEQLVADQTKESNNKACHLFSRAAESARQERQSSFAAKALRRAADLKLLLGDSKEARKLLTQSRALAKTAKDPVEDGLSLAALAYIYFLSGDGEATRVSSLQALELARKIENKQLEALALGTLGEAYYSAGDLKLAQRYQHESLKLCQEIGDRKCETRSAIALGYYYVNLSDPLKGIEFFDLGFNAASDAKDLQGQAQSLNAKGNLKAKLGEQQAAFQALNQARPLAERIGDQICLASILGGIGTVYRYVGDLHQSIRYVHDASRIFESIDEKWGIAEAHLDLGRGYKLLGNYEEAKTRFLAALAMFQAFGMERLEMQTLGELASVQRLMGQLDESLATYDKALRLSKLGQDQRHEAFLLNSIGQIYAKQNKADAALTLHQEALNLGRVAVDPLVQLNSLLNIARIERNQGRLEEARRDVESATTIAESVRARVSSPNLRASYLASVHQAYEVSIDILMQLQKQPGNEQLAQQAFGVAERAKARSFQELVMESRARSERSGDQALLERERVLSEQLNAKAERQMKLRGSKDRTEVDRLEEEIESLTGQYNELQDQIRVANPVAAALTTLHPLSVGDLQNQVVDDHSALLEFSLGEERSYAWVVTKTQMFSYELAGRSEIEAAANKLYQSLTAQQAQAGESIDARYERQRQAALIVPQDTQRLSQLVLGQLIDKLENKRILIIPDGALQYIPFSALMNPVSGELLVRNHEIMVEPSASALALIKKDSPSRQIPTKSVLVFADPVFERDDPRIKGGNSAKDVIVHSQQAREVLRDIGLSNGQDIPRLIASGVEANAIMAAIPWRSGRKEVDFSANRENVLSGDVANFQILHFATHGASNSEHPELSGIVLSLFDSNGQSRDGVLRLHDIYDLHIPASLVVLSACSTGLGKDVRGEGLIGLSRGFLHAGAKSVVASLWKVDDDATAELMGHFYQGIFRKRLTPAAALRFAQLEMAKQPRWQSPYYWAGFVIQGQDLTNEAITRNVSFSKAEMGVMAVSVVTMVLLPGVLLWLRRRRGLS